MEFEVKSILLLFVKYRRMGYGVWGKQFVIVCLDLCMLLVFHSSWMVVSWCYNWFNCLNWLENLKDVL
jgi:hypothetical protein